MILTNYFIRKKIHSFVDKGNRRTCCFRGLNEADTLLVIYDAKDREMVAVFLKHLRAMRKQVRTLVYGIPLPKGEGSFDLTLSPNTDLTCWGFPKDACCEKMKAIQADILIDFSRPTDYAARYLMLLHPCSFKVGVGSGGQALYDLSISVTDRDDIEQLCEHILFYLQSIRSK